MLPQLGFTEIILLSVLALVVIGPKDLPLMARKMGRWMAKMRGLAAEFRSGFDELARQAELDELKREVQALRSDRTFADLDREIRKPLTSPDPPALMAPLSEQEKAAATDAPPEGDETASAREQAAPEPAGDETQAGAAPKAASGGA